MPASIVRDARPGDAFAFAPLYNSGQEPHFHTTAAQLTTGLAQPGRFRMLEQDGRLLGGLSLWQPEDHDHLWVGFAMHPDHRADAPTLLDGVTGPLWTSVRADYLSAGPDLAALGFREVHRTFGGGFYLDNELPDIARLDTALAARGVTLSPAGPESETRAFYAAHCADKLTAPPTIPAANPSLGDPDEWWEAAWVARQAGQVVGLALPERAGLGAWNAVLLVAPAWRRQGVGTALQARVARSLAALGVTFLNTAGVKRDVAYLGVLRRLGANIEPDWIAYARP